MRPTTKRRAALRQLSLRLRPPWLPWKLAARGVPERRFRASRSGNLELAGEVILLHGLLRERQRFFRHLVRAARACAKNVHHFVRPRFVVSAAGTDRIDQ